jgi:Outer membrane protein (OmpH-like)
MRRFLAILVVASAIGCAPRIGYVDRNKAMNDTADGQAAIAALGAFASEKKAAIVAAQAEFKKAQDAKPDEATLKDAQAKLDDMARTAQVEFEQRQSASAAKISAGIDRILAKLRSDHHLDALVAKPLDVDPSLDLTAELVARYNNGDGAPLPPDEAAAKKIADLEKKVAGLESAKGIASNASQKQKGSGQ